MYLLYSIVYVDPVQIYANASSGRAHTKNQMGVILLARVTGKKPFSTANIVRS